MLDDVARRALALSVPSHLHGSLLRWVEHGIPPGDFLDRLEGRRTA